MNNKNKIIYSICICNYNMADTIEVSLNSLISQLDERFEIVFVDDGSTDCSLDIVKKFKQFKNIKIVSLKRSSKRKLGETRNISVRNANGIYAILHLDCDDIFGPHINDFIKVFHKLETCMKKDILVSGKHINMAKRKFLLEHGPYINIYRGEDRNLWSRMAKINRWIPLEHVDFITRTKKNFSKKLKKQIFDTIDHMINDFRSGGTLLKYFEYEFKKINFKKMRFKYTIFRLFMIIPCYIISKFYEPISQELAFEKVEEFASYRERVGGKYKKIMIENNCDPSLNFLSNNVSIKIFE